MLIYEKIEMLKLNPEKGRPYINLHYYLPLAALILDLYIKGNLSYENKKVQIRNPNYDDPLLKEPIKLILQGDKIHPIWRAFVLLRAISGVFINSEVYKKYIKLGILRDESAKRPKLYFNKENFQTKIIDEVKRTTLGVEKPDIENYFVLRALKIGHLLDKYFTKPEIKVIKALLKKNLSEIGIDPIMSDLINRLVKQVRSKMRVHS
ncbi:MAG: hypothetical protein ACFFDH_08925 [Promethearchaeota archaeon]